MRPKDAINVLIRDFLSVKLRETVNLYSEEPVGKTLVPKIAFHGILYVFSKLFATETFEEFLERLETAESFYIGNDLATMGCLPTTDEAVKNFYAFVKRIASNQRLLTYVKDAYKEYIEKHYRKWYDKVLLLLYNSWEVELPGFVGEINCCNLTYLRIFDEVSAEEILDHFLRKGCTVIFLHVDIPRPRKEYVEELVSKLRSAIKYVFVVVTSKEPVFDDAVKLERPTVDEFLEYLSLFVGSFKVNRIPALVFNYEKLPLPVLEVLMVGGLDELNLFFEKYGEVVLEFGDYGWVPVELAKQFMLPNLLYKVLTGEVEVDVNEITRLLDELSRIHGARKVEQAVKLLCEYAPCKFVPEYVPKKETEFEVSVPEPFEVGWDKRYELSKVTIDIASRYNKYKEKRRRVTSS